MADVVKVIPSLLDALQRWGRALGWAGFLASSLLLLGSVDVLAVLGQVDFVETYRTELGWTWIACCAALLIVYIPSAIHRRVARWSAKASLRNLYKAEKDLHIRYLERDTCTLYFDQGDGVAQGLAARGLLFTPPVHGFAQRLVVSNPRHRGVAFNITPWVRGYLMRHPALLAVEHGESWKANALSA